MASSLIGGLIAGGWPPGRIRVTDPDPDKRRALNQRYKIEAVTENVEAAIEADVVLLAVKPQVVSSVAREIGEGRQGRSPLIISIAAGVRETDIRRWLRYDASVVRAMPNTPSLVGSGVAGLFANEKVSDRQRDLAESVLRAVGMVLWVEREEQLDAVTAISGSGPAYFFLLMELMEESGTALGLPRETARLLALDTAFGASKMALESSDEPAVLRARVTSPGGTTEMAIRHMEEGGMRRLFADALEAARDRAVELGEQLGRE